MFLLSKVFSSKVTSTKDVFGLVSSKAQQSDSLVCFLFGLSFAKMGHHRSFSRKEVKSIEAEHNNHLKDCQIFLHFLNMLALLKKGLSIYTVYIFKQLKASPRLAGVGSVGLKFSVCLFVSMISSKRHFGALEKSHFVFFDLLTSFLSCFTLIHIIACVCMFLQSKITINPRSRWFLELRIVCYHSLTDWWELGHDRPWRSLTSHWLMYRSCWAFRGIS